MSRRRRQKFLRQFVLLLVFLGLIAYVIQDAVYGTHGLIARQRTDARISALASELAVIKAQRVRLERDAEALGAKASENTESLDEQARALLDLTHPADIVIINDPPSKDN